MLKTHTLICTLPFHSRLGSVVGSMSYSQDNVRFCSFFSKCIILSSMHFKHNIIWITVSQGCIKDDLTKVSNPNRTALYLDWWCLLNRPCQNAELQLSLKEIVLSMTTWKRLLPTKTHDERLGSVGSDSHLFKSFYIPWHNRSWRGFDDSQMTLQ